MRPEWQRVLVCCEDTAAIALQPALQQLRQVLPNAEITVINQADVSHFLTSQTQNSKLKTQNSLTSFNAAIIFTEPNQSPYAIAYHCYLAGIPIRIGQSQEFGGGVLSMCVQPPVDPISAIDHHLHLLNSAGLTADLELKIHHSIL